jgi:hypothetical protein
MTPEIEDESRYPSADFWAPKRPDWSKWQRTRQTKLWIAVVLASNLDPINFQLKKDGPLAREMYPLPQGVEDLLTAAKGSIGAGGGLRLIKMSLVGLEEAEVDMANFMRWLQSMHYPTPEGFPWAPEELDLNALHWPWGPYNTVLLRNLAAAVEKFWKNYDPTDSSTAPTNEQVSEWLTKQGVADRNAKAIATILRTDNLRPGPRKK